MSPAALMLILISIVIHELTGDGNETLASVDDVEGGDEEEPEEAYATVSLSFFPAPPCPVMKILC